MKLYGVCILTDNAPRLAAFYETELQIKPLVEGDHFNFDGIQLAVYLSAPFELRMERVKQRSYERYGGACSSRR